jgi:DNA-binding CsgD family transcriptional regulator
VVAHALRVVATVDPGPGRPALLQEARALLPAGTADRLAAQIDTDLAGLVLLSPHRRGDATGPADQPGPLELLRSAERLAGREELWPLQSRIRRLLDALGETPRRISSEAESVLTASELRVARLAAGGLGNRAIALELAVSVKAVEWHLGHVYRKLAISSRTDLAETLDSTA